MPKLLIIIDNREKNTVFSFVFNNNPLTGFGS